MKEVEFLDRVPTYPGRVKLVPVSGQADTYDMERADSPLVAGTPLDKATFESIIKSRLTGRYYMVTATRSELATQTGIKANPIPTSWFKVGDLECTSGVWRITASSGRGYTPDRAVDGNVSTYWISETGLSHQLTLDAGVQLTVKKMEVRLSLATSFLDTVTIRGSNDGLVWTNLGRYSSPPNGLSEFTLTTPGVYRYYQLNFQMSEAAQVAVEEWEFSEYDITTYKNEFTMPELPEQLETHQRVTILTPANVNTTGVSLNTLNGIGINMVLQPSKYYELVYGSGGFAVK